MAIVALWAAVLIPMWLRRHDDDQARRIERHRVAMGTLARMSDDADLAPAVASRRRRLVVACTATIGALGTAAWIAGMSAGYVSVALWLPFAVFLPLAVVMERRHSRAAATRALADRRQERAARTSRAVADSPVQADESESSIADPSHAGSTSTTIPSHRAVAWDDVFDQTA